MTGRRLLPVSFVVASTAAGCSLLTSLDAPRPAPDANVDPSSDAGVDCVTCEPTVLATFDGGAELTDLYVEPRTEALYVTAAGIGSVFVLPTDPAANAKPKEVLSGLTRPTRITSESYVNGTWDVFVAANGVFQISSDGGTRAIVPSPVRLGSTLTPLNARGIALGIGPAPPLLFLNGVGGSDLDDSAQVISTNLATEKSTLVAEVDGVGSGHDLVVTPAGDLWWSTRSAALFHQPSDGGAPQKVTGGAGLFLYYQGSGSDPPRVYFSVATGTAFTISAIDLPGFAISTFASTLVNQPFGLASDGTRYLYWTNNADQKIVRKAFTGSAPEVIATSPGAPKRIIFFRGALYWTTDNAIVRFVPPP